MKSVYYYKLVVVGEHGTMWSSNVSQDEYEQIEKRGRSYIGTKRCLRYKLRKVTRPHINGTPVLFVFSSPEECKDLANLYTEDKTRYILKGLAENPRNLLGHRYHNTVFINPIIPKQSIICTGFYPISIYGKA